MNEEPTNSFWYTDWLKAQKRYMDAWASLSGASAGPAAASRENGEGQAPESPWSRALEFWWKSVADSAGGNNREVFGKLVDQTRAFYFITDQMARFLERIAELGQATENLGDLLDKLFGEIKDMLMRSQQEAGQTMSGMLGAWQLPLDTWQRTLSSLSALPGDFLQGFKPEHIEQVTDRFLSVPGVGYTRESQEQAQEGLRLWARYQRSQYEYQTALGKVVISALDRLKERILKMAGEDQVLRSLREIYDLWIDCNEEAYAEFVFSDEHSRLYGRLVNDLMAFKRNGMVMVDEVVGALGMPTRQSMNTMRRRQQELRRELIEARVRLEAVDKKARRVTRLASELKQLREELEGFKTRLRESAGARKASPRKNAARPAADPRRPDKPV